MEMGIWALSKVDPAVRQPACHRASLWPWPQSMLAPSLQWTTLRVDMRDFSLNRYFWNLLFSLLAVTTPALEPPCKKSGSSIIRAPCDVITPEWCVWSVCPVWCDEVNTRAPCDEPCVNPCPVWCGTKLTPAAAGSLQILFYNETSTAQLGQAWLTCCKCYQRISNIVLTHFSSDFLRFQLR